MLVFHDISSFDAENPIVGLLLQELDVASDPIKKSLPATQY